MTLTQTTMRPAIKYTLIGGLCFLVLIFLYLGSLVFYQWASLKAAGQQVCSLAGFKQNTGMGHDDGENSENILVQCDQIIFFSCIIAESRDHFEGCPIYYVENNTGNLPEIFQ